MSKLRMISYLYFAYAIIYFAFIKNVSDLNIRFYGSVFLLLYSIVFLVLNLRHLYRKQV